MPYSSVGELPDAVKKLSPTKQRQFMYVWNSVYKQTGSEERAFKAAWSAVKESDEELSKTFYQKGEGMKIRGVAISAGLSKNRNLYLDEELMKLAPSLVNRPIYYEHPGSGNSVGQVTHAKWLPDKRHIEYEAEIFEPDAVERIRRGLIKHVSICAGYQTLGDVSDIQVPLGLGAEHLGLVVDPGVPDASIEVMESKLIIESYTEPAGKGIIIEPTRSQLGYPTRMEVDLDKFEAEKAKTEEPPTMFVRTPFGLMNVPADGKRLALGQTRVRKGLKICQNPNTK